MAHSVFDERFRQLAAEPEVSKVWLSFCKTGAGPTALPVGKRQNSLGTGVPPPGQEEEHAAAAAAAAETCETRCYDVIVQTSQRDFVRDKKTKILSEFRLTDTADGSATFERRSVFPQPLGGDVVGVVLSPSGAWRCVLRNRIDDGKTKSEFEFWNRAALVSVVDVTDIHGKVMLDNDQFGHLVWSPCERFVAYSAEKLLTKAEKEDPSYNKYDFKQKEDWGEQLGGVSLLRPFVIALNPASSCIGQALMRPRVFGVTIAGGSDAASRFENFSMGQPVFAPGLDGLLVTAWSIHPRRLGLVFCQQRVSVILHLPFYPIGGEKRATHSRSPAAQSTRLSQFCRKIPMTLNHITVSADRVRRCSPLGDIATSAQFSPDGKRVVMLIHDRVPTHGTVKGLAVLDWTDFESRGSSKAFMAIPFVRGTAEDGSTFPGIFAVALRSFCWNLESTSVSLSTQWGCVVSVVTVDLGPAGGSRNIGLLRRMTSESDGSAVLCGNCSSGLLVCESQPSRPPSLRVVRHHEGHAVRWQQRRLRFRLQSDQAGDFGFFVARREGSIVVSKVPKNGPGDIAGLCVGDIVKAVNGTLISRKMKPFVALVNGKTQIDLDVERVSGGTSYSAGAGVPEIDVTPKRLHVEEGKHGAGELTTAPTQQPRGVEREPALRATEQERARLPQLRQQHRLPNSSCAPFFITTSDGRFEEDPATAVHWEVVKMVSNDGGDVRLVEGVLLGPASSSVDFPELAKPVHAPLVVYPHGGPHSGFTAQYDDVAVRYLVSVGYAVLLINYRGSTGYGSKAIESLVGKCGTQDVQDCVDLLEAVLSAHGAGVSTGPAALTPTSLGHLHFDRGMLAIYGGSHGGFLTAHLIGQFPKLFRAACLRNPVVDIPSMVGTTDIPDWCFVETGHDYDFSKPFRHATPETLTAMHAASPLRLAGAVCCPVMIFVGEQDRRVPLQQGVQYYHALKAAENLVDEEIRLNVYPTGNHSLRSIECERHMWPQIASWFKEHVRSTK